MGNSNLASQFVSAPTGGLGCGAYSRHMDFKAQTLGSRTTGNQIAHVRKLTRYFSFFLICLRSLSPKEQELIADATHAFRFFFTSVPSSHWLLRAIPKVGGGPWGHYS